MWPQIAAQISQKTGKPFEAVAHRPIGGGSISQAYFVSNRRQSYFVKLNRAERLPMFEAEAQGLQKLWETQTIRVPQPICWGMGDNSAYLVLEWLELGNPNEIAWKSMGRNLATLHQVTSPNGFGWDINNTIGSTPQINTWSENWAEFFAQHRLGYQFQLARQRGAYFPRQSQLMAIIPKLLSHALKPALVHGDLWSGNAAFMKSGEPLTFDPATYFGDREVDLAMTELFGGFPAEFYRSYNQAYPLDVGYKQRKTLYNLYHILNHYNLFGGNYEAQANRMIEQIVG
jgi:fructosamine-3-kinase